MTTEDIIIHIFYLVAASLPDIPRHSQAKLYPSELVTIRRSQVSAPNGVSSPAPATSHNLRTISSINAKPFNVLWISYPNSTRIPLSRPNWSPGASSTDFSFLS
jgi:hypothetical protein